MEIKTIKAYYCDFCGKRMLSASWMSRHEKNCTMNPNRGCGMCGRPVPLDELIEKYSGRIDVKQDDQDAMTASFKPGAEFKTDDIDDDCNNCPACTLAVLRQAGLNHSWILALTGEFDYKKRKDEWWADKNLDPEFEGY